MQIGGLKVLAVFSAALAVYLTGFIIYGLLLPSETWMAWSNISAEELEAVGTSRMPFSVLMPILIAIGVGLAVKWRHADSLAMGASTGIMLGFFLLVGGRLYGYVYGVEGINILLVDSVHLLLNGLVAGAVLGVWSNRSYVNMD